MNKTDAAQALGVSVRAVERYAAAGRLPSRYERGKTGRVLAFDDADVQRLKEELEAPQERAAIMPDKPRQRPPQRQDTTDPTSTALATVGGRGGPYEAAFAQVLSALAQIDPTSTGKARQHPPVPTEAKLMLTLAEAQALSGLSRGVLRAAIDEGTLKAQTIGRGFKIKRGDLDSYIDKL